MRKSLIIVLLLSSPAALLSAAEKIKPGLWEMTARSNAFQGMPGIPPEQLEQLRQMGITMPQVKGDTIVTKVCIPKAMAEREQPPYFDQQQTGCQVRNYQRKGKDYSADIMCRGPQMQGDGSITGTIESSERFQSTYEFNGTIEGAPVKHRQESSGKWLAADCGSVKPLPDFSKGK